jgi:hypothetical protein
MGTLVGVLIRIGMADLFLRESCAVEVAFGQSAVRRKRKLDFDVFAGQTDGCVPVSAERCRPHRPDSPDQREAPPPSLSTALMMIARSPIGR